MKRGGKKIKGEIHMGRRTLRQHKFGEEEEEGKLKFWRDWEAVFSRRLRDGYVRMRNVR